MNTLPTLALKHGHPVATSLAIAADFDREHKNVLRDIQNLDCSEEFSRLNFEPRDYIDERGKSQPMVEMTRDGFAFLCMGFTGPKAAQWKEAYINAFNQMDLALRGKLPPDPKTGRYLLPPGADPFALVDPGILRELRILNPRLARQYLALRGIEPDALDGGAGGAGAHGWDGKAVALPHFLPALRANLHRFAPFYGAGVDVPGLLGYRFEDLERGAFLALYPQGLAELAGACDVPRLLHELSWAGWLWRDVDRLTHKSPAVPSLRNWRPYLYFISAAALAEGGRDGQA